MTAWRAKGEFVLKKIKKERLTNIYTLLYLDIRNAMLIQLGILVSMRGARILHVTQNWRIFCGWQGWLDGINLTKSGKYIKALPSLKLTPDVNVYDLEIRLLFTLGICSMILGCVCVCVCVLNLFSPKALMLFLVSSTINRRPGETVNML